MYFCLDFFYFNFSEIFQLRIMILFVFSSSIKWLFFFKSLLSNGIDSNKTSMNSYNGIQVMMLLKWRGICRSPMIFIAHPTVAINLGFTTLLFTAPNHSSKWDSVILFIIGTFIVWFIAWQVLFDIVHIHSKSRTVA